MSDFPEVSDPAPILLTQYGAPAIGTELAALATAAPASVAHGTANLARAYPFVVPEPIVVVKLFWYNGATANGNTDVGVYTEDGTKIASTGAIAQAGTNAVQENDIADFVLGRGRYYLALSSSSATATYFSNVTSIQFAKTLAWAQMASAHVLPATFVLAAYSAAICPVFGLSTRTLVV